MLFHGRGRSGQLHLLLLACGQCAAGIGAFTEPAPLRGAVAERLRGLLIGGSRKYGEKIFTPNGVNLQYFRLEPTPLGSERGEQPLSCNDDDRCLRQKQGGVVGAVASRMQGPLKGRSIRWEPQPVQGRGVSREREGGVETPLSPSGPAERPRRRCTLQKASDLPHATTLCAGKDGLECPPRCSGHI